VGTVWLAVASAGGKLKSRRFVWPGTRDQVRTLAAYWALAMVLKTLRDDGAE
jgi:nicotinamide mononucleotide (NMN) deamidase PncC